MALAGLPTPGSLPPFQGYFTNLNWCVRRLFSPLKPNHSAFMHAVLLGIYERNPLTSSTVPASLRFAF